MRSWRCSGFESGAIEASNRQRRRHYFSGRAFWLKLPPGYAETGNSGSMAETKPDGGLRRTGAPALRTGLVRVDWSASRRANSLFHQPGLEFSQLVAEEVHGFGCGHERGIEVHERERAAQTSVQVVRVFVRLRQMLASNAELARKLAALENKYDAQFKVVFDAIRQLMSPPETKRREIGFHVKYDDDKPKSKKR
jgi:hypothetical protein